MELDEFEGELILAAEDFPDELFHKYHSFSGYENKIIRKLMTHGPVLIRGGRGSGKSALMKEAFFRVNASPHSESIIGVYLSLRHLPLLRTQGKDYENYFCRLLIERIKETLTKSGLADSEFDPLPEVGDLQQELYKLSTSLNRRIVLFFDDAAHIGRETSLKEFFDIFRTLSNNTVSCKAAIYPGVTEFGSRFDLLNDANVIDIARNEETPFFTSFFKEIIEKRYSNQISQKNLTTLSLDDFAKFIGRAVTGNVRAFIYAINYIIEISDQDSIGIPEIERTLKYLAAEYYWPLFEELQPKLGIYEPLIDPTTELAELLYRDVSESVDRLEYAPACLIHRDVVEKLKKLFEIMEYVGFLVKRDSSRAMSNGGRGTRYILNLCCLIEYMPNPRLTHDLFIKWNTTEKGYTQIYRRGILDKIQIPPYNESRELGILEMPIEVLRKSKAYPYGLSDYRMGILIDAGVKTVGDIAEATDEYILSLNDIGDHWLNRIKSVMGQAIWM